MTLVASDGFEYADVKARLLGQPLENQRNWNVKAYRDRGYSEAATSAYIKAFDRRWSQGGKASELLIYAHREGVEAAYATGGFCIPSQRAAEAEEDRRLFGHPDPRTITP